MIGVKTRDSLPKASPAANLGILEDVSGSMATEHKFTMVKEALWQFVGQLRPGDRLAIVAYNADQAWLLGAANGDDLQSAYQAIELLEPGATATQHHDVSLAFDIAREQFIFKGQNRIIHCSDGDFSFG
jgi:Ca-activated chloride channel family protein